MNKQQGRGLEAVSQRGTSRCDDRAASGETTVPTIVGPYRSCLA
jgi:hypothetical protein